MSLHALDTRECRCMFSTQALLVFCPQWLLFTTPFQD